MQREVRHGAGKGGVQASLVLAQRGAQAPGGHPHRIHHCAGLLHLLLHQLHAHPPTSRSVIERIHYCAGLLHLLHQLHAHPPTSRSVIERIHHCAGLLHLLLHQLHLGRKGKQFC
jgi:hypothetical protein